jgi:ribosomal protein S18 acetylase RimI-like enzyme
VPTGGNADAAAGGTSGQQPIMTDYRIVNARPHDIDRIAAIELAAAELLRPYAAETALREITSPEELLHAQREGRLWIALAGDDPIGFALVGCVTAGSAHLEEIDVHPDHGRRGLGRRLVEQVCAWAQENGLSIVTLTTFRDVVFNMPFYTKLGFNEIPVNELTPELIHVMRKEEARGLDPARRVAMYRSVKPLSLLNRWKLR